MTRLAWVGTMALESSLIFGALAGGSDTSVQAGYRKYAQPIPGIGADGNEFTNNIETIENLGESIPPGLVFTDGHGKAVAVDSLLHQGKPILVTMGYYRCPQLCNLVHEGLVKAIKESGLRLGQDFLGLAISIDPNEEAKSANTNQGRLLRSLQAERRPEQWPFVMGNAVGVNAVAQAIGFRYKYDDKSKQFAHEAVFFVLSPAGKISRYMYGVSPSGRDLRMAVVEASEGRVGTTIDRVLQICFKYDPMKQRYSPYLFGFVRIGAMLSFLALATLLAVLWRREWVLRRRRPV